MAGFIRRYPFVPSPSVTTLIEGVIIADLPPPGSIAGTGVGTVAVVGEFQDMTYAGSPLNGVWSTNPQPQQVTSFQDILNRFGGFDPTIGDFGNGGGNGYVVVKNKQFSALVIIPINLASAEACRYFRHLPTNQSATNPVPVVPMQAATVPAGTQFMSGANRLLGSGRSVFTALGPYMQGIDANVLPSGLPAATQTLTIGLEVASGQLSRSGSTVTATVSAVPSWLVVGSQVWLAAGETNFPAGLKTVVTAGATTFTYTEAGSATTSSNNEFFSLYNFKTGNAGAPVGVGDIFVLGVVAGASSLGTDAGTFRIQSVTDTGDIVIEQMDGSNFTSSNWVSGAALPWRVHPSSDADSGGANVYATAAGYTIPVRPLDANIATGLSLLPAVVAAVETATTWNPLSNLHLLTQGSTASTHGATYTAAIQAPNAVNAGGIDSLYSTALASLLTEALPQRNVNIVVCARHDANIRATLHTDIDQAASQGLGHMGMISPELQSVLSSQAATATTDPGVGGNRDERLVYCWPGAQMFLPEAANISIALANGLKTTSGVIDTHFDAWVASVLSVLPPERNPAQVAQPVPSVFAPIAGLQTGLTAALGINDYILMRQQGVCGLRIDADVGPVIQSGITTSLTSGQTNINRRRMADYIEDSIAAALKPLVNLPLTNQVKDTIVGQITAFLGNLQSVSNPAAQRIQAFNVDDKSGNTADQLAQGIYVVIVQVQMLPTADFIVLQAQISPQALTVTTN